MTVPISKRPVSFKLLIGLYLPCWLLLLTVFLASRHSGIPLAMFTRDPADITNTSPFLGVVSNICILLWCATAAICFLSFFILKSRPHRKMASFFLVAGLITSLLMLDDLFLLHERVFPNLFHLRQRYIFVTYGSIIYVYLVSFRKTIFKTNFMTLALALGFFFLSIAVDGMSDMLGIKIPYYHLFEDGFKLIGLASWLGYFGEASLHAINPPDN